MIIIYHISVAAREAIYEIGLDKIMYFMENSAQV